MTILLSEYKIINIQTIKNNIATLLRYIISELRFGVFSVENGTTLIHLELSSETL